jgi:hypothetical protein
LLGSVGTAGALLIAASALRKQVDDQRSDQASRVAVSQDEWITTVANESSFVINLHNIQWATAYTPADPKKISLDTKFVGAVGQDFRDKGFPASHTDIFPMNVRPKESVRFNTPRQFPDGEDLERPPDLTLIIFDDRNGRSWARLNIGPLFGGKDLWRIDLRRRSRGPNVLKGMTIHERIVVWVYRWRMWRWGWNR